MVFATHFSPNSLCYPSSHIETFVFMHWYIGSLEICRRNRQKRGQSGLTILSWFVVEPEARKGMLEGDTALRPKPASWPAKLDAFPELIGTLASAAVLVAAIVVAYVGPVDAAGYAKRGNICEINGWGENGEGATIAVRARPNYAARIVGFLPTDQERPIALDKALPYERSLAEFSIYESKAGWFRIGNSRIVTLKDASWEKASSPLSGWIRAENIRFNVESHSGHAAPRQSSNIVVSNPGPIHENWSGLEACNGKWAKVSLMKYDDARPSSDHDATPKSVRAWVTAICGEAMTGCE
jgi:hypothetical protein